jgi:hypothetical protein
MINTSRISGSLTALAVVAVLSLSCGDDSTTPPPPPTTSGFQNLSQKGHVLNNFEQANNKRDTTHYDALLDTNFTFSYDASNGGAPVLVQWGRETDVPVTRALFAAVDRIDMTLDFHDGVTWSEVPSGAETWYATTVFYHFTIKIGNSTYIPSAGAKISFTVRNAGTAEVPQWKLVELRDLGGPSVFNTNKPMSTASTEVSTYGTVKALYR